MSNLVERDQQHIWHPLTQHKLKKEMLPIKKASGVWLTDDAGKKYIDGISSWYTAVYGHCNEYIYRESCCSNEKPRSGGV